MPNGKFAQSDLGEFSDPPYNTGLSPMELELVSEIIQRDKIRKTGSDVEV